MLRLVDQVWQYHLDLKEALQLENEILLMLDFDLQYVSPLAFLERYLRLFGMDQESKSKGFDRFTQLTTQLIRVIMRDQIYLDLKPSVIAALCLTVAVNICLSSSVSKEIGLRDLKIQNLKRVRRGGTFYEIDNWNPDFDPNSELQNHNLL